MTLRLVVIHMDMVIETLPLERGEYTIGRSQENNIVVQHFSLELRQGKILCQDDRWIYRDGKTGKEIPITDNESISLSDQIFIASQRYVENEKTHINDFASLMSQHKGDLKKRLALVGGIAAALLLIAFGGYQIFKSNDNPMNPNLLLAQVRKHVVEFEAVKDEKAIEDFKAYGALEDSDFKDSVGFCTGFLVAPNVILTASHCLFGHMVIDLNNDFVIKTADGKKHKIKNVLGFDIKRDYLFLEVENMKAYGFLEFAPNYKVGQKVFTVGNVHGEGVAIRDGIMASETPDLNDPEVKFVRYSAGASPGNSGGPLIDEYGRIVALVFASTWTENYNLGTSVDDLKIGFEKFVEGREDKGQDVVIEMKKLLNYNPQSLLQALSLPYLPQFAEYPEITETFNDIKINVNVPILLEKIDEDILSKLNKEVISSYLEVQKLLRKKKEITLDWTSFLSKETPTILPSQFDYSQNIFIKSENRYFPKQSGFIDSPSKSDMTKYKEQLEKQNKFDFQAYGYNIDYTKKTLGFDKGDLFYKPKKGVGRKKRLQELAGGAPYSQLLVKPGFSYSAKKYPLTINAFFKNFLGFQGALASSFSRYIRPKSAKDFTITQLEPESKSSIVDDKVGRKWNRSFFKIFENTNVFTYCHLLPEGSICMGRIFNVKNKYLLKVIENNFRKFVLSHLVINPYFWKKDKILGFLKSDASQGMKSMEGIEFEKRDDGLWGKLAEFPFQFRIPSDASVDSIRLQTGLFGDRSQSKWTGYGIEWIKVDPQGGDKVCGIGVEPFNSQSNFILNFRRDRKKQEKLKKMKGDDAKPLPGIWYKLYRGLKKPMQVYGYCAPLVEDPRIANNFFVDFKKAKALRYKYKIGSN